MSPFLCSIFLLGISSLATAANFTLVYEWQDENESEWPSEAIRTQVLKIHRFFKPWNIEPRYMAVYGSRIFLSLMKNLISNFPATLVSLPTSSASSAPPKLTPFPSRDMHSMGNCSIIESAAGLEVDSVGRLWVLDSGSEKCEAKLWIFDLMNNDQTKLIHQFSFYGDELHELVLDETANETFAYFSWWEEELICVFCLERNQSWTVETPGMDVSSIALSPKNQEPRLLYLASWNSDGLRSISVAALRNNKTRTANPKHIGNWIDKKITEPARMLMDNHGTLYISSLSTNYIISWNTFQPFKEQRFHEVAGLESEWPFTFALDENGTFWMTEFDEENNPRYRLLKTTLEEKSSEASPVTPAIPTTSSTTTVSQKSEPTPPTSTERSCAPIPSTKPPEVQENSILTEKVHLHQLFNIILICSNVFTVILFWFILRKKRINSLSPNTIEAHQITFIRKKPADYHEFQNDDNSRSPSSDLRAAENFQFMTGEESVEFRNLV